jgi:hypothetical protein
VSSSSIPKHDNTPHVRRRQRRSQRSQDDARIVPGRSEPPCGGFAAAMNDNEIERAGHTLEHANDDSDHMNPSSRVADSTIKDPTYEE